MFKNKHTDNNGEAIKPKKTDAARVKTLSSIAGVSVAIALFGAGYGIWANASANAAIALSNEGTTPTLSAKAEIKAGDTLEASMFEVKNVPEVFRVQGALDQSALSGSDAIVGKLALVDIAVGSQLTAGAIAGGGTSTSLAAAIDPGTEAITVAVDAESGFAGALHQGDRVRVMSIDEAATGEVISNTLITSARVVALDAQLSGTDTLYTSVTLCATPEQADAIRIAQASSKISLALIPSVG